MLSVEYIINNIEGTGSRNTCYTRRITSTRVFLLQVVNITLSVHWEGEGEMMRTKLSNMKYKNVCLNFINYLTFLCKEGNVVKEKFDAKFFTFSDPFSPKICLGISYCRLFN